MHIKGEDATNHDSYEQQNFMLISLEFSKQDCNGYTLIEHEETYQNSS